MKKGLILGLVGFIIGVFVGWAFLYLMGSDRQWTVLSVALQFILSGVLGAVAMGFAVVYEVDSWSVTRCTVTHALITIGSYLTIGLTLGWFHFDSIGTYIMIACYIVGYFMIWLIMYLVSKKQTRELDEQLKQWKRFADVKKKEEE